MVVHSRVQRRIAEGGVRYLSLRRMVNDCPHQQAVQSPQAHDIGLRFPLSPTAITLGHPRLAVCWLSSVEVIVFATSRVLPC